MEWSFEKNVIEDGSTDAFGEILFLGSENTSKFVKCSSKHVDDSQILELLYSKAYWNIRKPKLLISVSGGVIINLKPGFISQFCKGLEKSAVNTSNY